MQKIKNILTALLYLINSVIYCQYTDQINSNRPGDAMSAYAVGKSVFQVESGFYGITQNHSIQQYESNGFGVDLMMRWGVFKEQLEVIADLHYQYEAVYPSIIYPEKSAMRQTVLGAKYLIYDPHRNYKKKIDLYRWKKNNTFSLRQLIPAVSLFAGANIVTAKNPYYFSNQSKLSPKIALITQNQLGDGSWVFLSNIIFDYIGTNYPSYNYVATLTKGINKKWSGFIENQGFKSNFYSDVLIRGGAVFLFHDDLQIDVSISSSLKTTPSIVYGGFGFSWRYDKHHKTPLIKVKTNDSEKKETPKKETSIKKRTQKKVKVSKKDKI